jgi:hypothetical protein
MLKNVRRSNQLGKMATSFSQLMLLTLWMATGTAIAADDPYTQLTDAFSERLADLAAACERAEENELAVNIRSWLPTRETNKIYLYSPTAKGSDRSKSFPTGSPMGEQFQQLRRQHGEQLLKLAKKSAANGQPTCAVMLLCESLYHAPDLEQARRLLGYEKHHGRWISAEAARRGQQGELWSDRFGWLPENHLARYEGGQRYSSGRWINAEQDARQHQDIRKGWRIETEHYEVTTNHSLQAGVALARRLEQLYSAWWQLFAGYHLTAKSARQMFAQGRSPRQRTKKHKVIYFRNRAQYDAALGRLQPGIVGKTLGVYFEKLKTAYFFAAAEGDAEEKELERITVWHEGSHQLFAEMIPARKVSELENNFWIVEGIACFMETLQASDGYFTLGGMQEGRLPAARIRLEQDQYYVPFDRLVAYSAADVQRDPNYRTLYTQAAGQAAFLMLADGGRLRAATIDYLRDIYRGRARPETLALKAEQRLSDLDDAYREFLSDVEPERSDR